MIDHSVMDDLKKLAELPELAGNHNIVVTVTPTGELMLTPISARGLPDVRRQIALGPNEAKVLAYAIAGNPRQINREAGKYLIESFGERKKAYIYTLAYASMALGFLLGALLI